MQDINEFVYQTLKSLHDEQVEYILKNNLGLPHANMTMQQALVALTVYEEQQNQRVSRPEPPDAPPERKRF